MYVIPLSVGKTSSVSIAENPIEQSIPYDIVLAKKPSGSKRQSKRVKKQATRPKKRKKTLLTIDDSSDEEVEVEEQEDKQPEKVIVSKQQASKTRQAQKPKIEMINTTISNEGNFMQMNIFYDL